MKKFTHKIRKYMMNLRNLMKKNKFIKININIIIIFLFNVYISTSQSTPDTLELEINRPYKYYKVTEIDSSFIRKEVWIDFKNNSSDTIVYSIKDFDFDIKMFSTRDKFHTGLNEDLLIYFLENWIFDTKTGFLKDCYYSLDEVLNLNPRSNCFITKIKILKLPDPKGDNYFDFIIEYFIIFDKQNSKIRYRLQKYNESILNSRIKGFVVFDKNKE